MTGSTAMPTLDQRKAEPTVFPEISDDRLAVLTGRIKPLVRHQGELHEIVPVDHRKHAFTWEPKVTVRVEGLREIARVTTLHQCGYYGFFKPSVAEVLACLTDEQVSGVTAFEIDLDTVRVQPYGDGHSATTILYGE